MFCDACIVSGISVQLTANTKDPTSKMQSAAD